jgi:site-specific recombinase XerD
MPLCSSNDEVDAGGLPLNLSIHQLRHTFGSLLLDRGVPLEQVSEFIGHSSISITKDIYGHLLPETLRDVAETM